MYQYRCLAESFKNPDCGPYRGYGVQVLNGDAVVAYIPDITTDKKRLCTLVDRCNRCRLDPLHLPEVVEDFLND